MGFEVSRRQKAAERQLKVIIIPEQQFSLPWLSPSDLNKNGQMI